MHRISNVLRTWRPISVTTGETQLAVAHAVSFLKPTEVDSRVNNGLQSKFEKIWI
jgi:hypothetical protein